MKKIIRARVFGIFDVSSSSFENQISDDSLEVGWDQSYTIEKNNVKILNLNKSFLWCSFLIYFYKILKYPEIKYKNKKYQ